MPLEIPTKYPFPLKKKVSLKTSFTFMLIIVLIIWSLVYTGFNFGDLMIGIPQIGDLFKQMIPPDFEYLQQIPPMLDTIRMAIVSTVLGSIVSIPIALLCASNIIIKSGFQYPRAFKYSSYYSRFVISSNLCGCTWNRSNSRDISTVYFNYLYYWKIII